MSSQKTVYNRKIRTQSSVLLLQMLADFNPIGFKAGVSLSFSLSLSLKAHLSADRRRPALAELVHTAGRTASPASNIQDACVQWSLLSRNT